MKLKKINTTIILLALALFICCISYSGETKKQKDPSEYLIWVHSDIQPKNEEQLKNFSDAVDDIVHNIGKINIAITAGDIPESGSSAYIYDWYLKTRSAVQTDTWFAIAGNHDWKKNNLTVFQERISPDLYYAVKAGNIIIIFLSNSKRGSVTIIPDDVFLWWKKLVMDNQDKILITVSHATLKHSGLIQSKFHSKRLFIKNSKDFEKVMKKYRVDIWLSGHSHLPGYLPYTDNKNNDLNGTVFIDIGSIRKDFMTDVESRFLVFKNGSNEFTLRHRLHEKKCYKQSRERKYMLPFPFAINPGEKPAIINRYKKAS